MKSNKIAGDVCGVKVQGYSSKCGNMQNAKSMCIEPVRTHHCVSNVGAVDESCMAS